MTAPIRDREPACLTAGDTLLFNKTVPNYSPADGWALSYAFMAPDGSAQFVFAPVAAANGVSWSANVASATTKTFRPGGYKGQARVTLAATGETHVVWTGWLVVNPDLSLKSDTRTPARKILDCLDAVMAGRAGDDILDSMVEGTQIRRLPVEQLVVLHDRYRSIVQGEERAAKVKSGRASGRMIYARFGGPTGSPGSPLRVGFDPYGYGGTENR